jgi:hypothetical protein
MTPGRPRIQQPGDKPVPKADLPGAGFTDHAHCFRVNREARVFTATNSPRLNQPLTPANFTG